MKKRLVTVGLAMMTAIILLIAGCGEGKNYIEMSYYDETFYEEGADYSTINENLFYRNERKVDVADHWFYMIYCCVKRMKNIRFQRIRS